MNTRTIGSLMLAGTLLTTVVGCSTGTNLAQTPKAVAAAAQATATVLPTTLPELSATASPSASFALDDESIAATGEVKAAQDADLFFQVPGIVLEVKVDEGQRVKKGDVLAELDLASFDQQVAAAEANLQTAQARLEQAREGRATEQDLSAAQAQVRAANAQANKARTGNVTPADIASAEAAIRTAEANLERAKTGGVRSQDIANAEAAVRAAEARLEAAQRGARPEQLAAAQTAVQQAEQQAQKAAAATSAAKSNAEQAMQVAADNVRKAQELYSSAYWDLEQAKAGKDPKTGKDLNPLLVEDEAVIRQYQAAFNQAEIALHQAEATLEQAKVNYETAKQQEINDTAAAQAQVTNARAQLDALLRGPQDTDITQLQAAVDQARAQLSKLQQGGAPADVAAAQGQLDQARAALQKMRQGGSPSDVAAARAQVDAATAQLEKLTAPAAPSDISIAEAGVKAAESQLSGAQLSRERATLRASFDGVVSVVNVDPGDTVAPSGPLPAVRLVDPSGLHIDVQVNEADIARVQMGQTASVTFDALPDQPVKGTITYIAPAATVVQNVRSYLVRIELPRNTADIRVGMSATVLIAAK